MLSDLLKVTQLKSGRAGRGRSSSDSRALWLEVTFSLGLPFPQLWIKKVGQIARRKGRLFLIC